MDALDAILTRRTRKKFTGEPLGRERIEQLLELAVWAPNHKLTEPWRFFVVPHARLGGLLDALRTAVRPDDPDKVRRKLEQLEVRIPRLGAFVNLAQVPAADAETHREDFAACCCAAHNILLGATALGLGCFWSTSHLFDRPPVRAFLGMSPELERVASIWLGESTEVVESRRRPAAERTRWVGEDGE